MKYAVVITQYYDSREESFVIGGIFLYSVPQSATFEQMEKFVGDEWSISKDHSIRVEFFDNLEECEFVEIPQLTIKNRS